MKPGERLIAWLLPHKVGEDSAFGYGRLHTYRLNRVTLVLEYDPNDSDGEFVGIDKILAAQQGNGDGTQLLRLICGMADIFGVKLHLYARAMDDKPWSTDRLLGWYQRHGFIVSGTWRLPESDPDEVVADHAGYDLCRKPLDEATRIQQRDMRDRITAAVR
jgi:hypothetical protein